MAEGDRNTREAIRRELCFFAGWDSEYRPSLDQTLETIRTMRRFAQSYQKVFAQVAKDFKL
jgi:hypothetical protein